MYSLLVITLVVSLSAKLFKHNGSMSKYVMFCVAICFMSFLLTPVFGFIHNVPKFFENGKIDSYNYDCLAAFSYKELLLNSTDNSLRSVVCEISLNKFDIVVDDENVLFEYDAQDVSNVIIKSITIDLTDYINIRNVRELEEYISDMFLCRCEVLLA